MSITDELREYVNQTPVPKSRVLMEARERFNAIADRIDAEHERAMADAYLSGTPTDEKLTELGCIRLPKDADGVPWNPGDRDEDGNEVTELRLTSSGWCVLTDDEWPYRPERHRHYHAPTVENVLQEFTSAIFEWSRKSGTVAEVGTWSDVAAKYAAQLQLKEY